MWTWKATVENQDNVDWFNLVVGDEPPTHAPQACFPGLEPETMLHFESDYVYAAHDDTGRDVCKVLGQFRWAQGLCTLCGYFA